MLRKHSIIKYVLLALLAIVGVLLCVVPFNVPGSTDRYNSLVGSIEKGFELRGGVSAVYVLDGTNNSKTIDQNIDKLEKLINHDGVKDFYLYRQGENKIRFDVAGATETDTIFSYIENSKELSVTLDKASDELTNPKVYLTSGDVNYAYGDYSSTSSAYGVQIEFSSLENINKMKAEAKTLSADKAYVYVGEIKSDNLLAEVNIDDFKNTIFVTAVSGSSYSTTEYSSCREIAYSITTGTFGKKLTLEEACFVSPVLGNQTLLLLAIASLIIVVLTFAFMWVRYGDLGLISILSLTFFLIFDIFLLQAIPNIILNVNGFFGIVLGYFVAVISHVMLIEKIKKEYAIGKKIHISCKSAFRLTLWQELDLHFMLAFAGLMIWIIAPAGLKIFGITLLIGLLVSLVAIEGLMRLFIKTYLPINASNAKRMHLYRDENVVEIKEEEESAPNTSVIGGINE